MNWEKLKKLNVKIEVPQRIKTLLFLVIGTLLMTSLVVEFMDYLPLKVFRVVNFLAPAITAIPAIIVFIKEKKSFKELFAGSKLRQVLCGVAFGAVLLTVSAIKNHGFQWYIGTSLFSRYDWYKVYISFNYLIIVGFFEEFTYRVVMQDYLIGLMGKLKVLAPFVTAVIFAQAHYTVGNRNTMLIALLWGLMWGYLRYFGKSFNFLALGISHGIYDYGLIVIPYILTKI